MDLSVVIVNYNVRHFLEQCLHSVRKASMNNNCEVFVVDNNSADGSCSMVMSQFPEVRLIRNTVNKGFSVANNQAIKLSRGKFILLLNPDTLVEEDTFTRCLQFMKEHPEAGALGVKMINGNGKLLPESKRALPTLETAFFKMSGLSVLFPKSQFFNRYYLGHLDSSATSEAEIISGAYMFIRKEAMDKTGLLDESFFMYGEDIDLSYRLLKAGYRNYYFPEVKIVHYKGESTKKGDINYIVHFYRAMIIFVRKHFTEKRHVSFIIFITAAIYFWGLIAILKSLIRKAFLPVADILLLSGLFNLIIPVWENWRFNGEYHYPEKFHIAAIAGYAIVTVISIYLTGGYKQPTRLGDVIKGLIFSIISVLIIYSLLPLNFRFSRAVMLFGALSCITIIPLYRYLLSLTDSGFVKNPSPFERRIAFVGDQEGLSNIRSLLAETGINNIIIGRVSSKSEDLGNEVLGSLDQLMEVVRINRINEVIFSTRELTASQIINSMLRLSEYNVTIRISPTGEKLIIGSKFINLKNDIFSVGDPLLRKKAQKNRDT